MKARGLVCYSLYNQEVIERFFIDKYYSIFMPTNTVKTTTCIPVTIILLEITYNPKPQPTPFLSYKTGCNSMNCYVRIYSLEVCDGPKTSVRRTINIRAPFPFSSRHRHYFWMKPELCYHARAVWTFFP